MKYTKTFTLTFGNAAQNHKNMQIIGKHVDEGLSLSNLQQIITYFKNKNAQYRLIHLNQLINQNGDSQSIYMPMIDSEPAYLLVVKNGVKYLLEDDSAADNLFQEQDILEKDKKALMYGRVVDKKARHNLCFSDFDQQADYQNGKGTVINFNKLLLLNNIRNKLSTLLANDKLTNLQCQGNYYYDIKKTYIGFHGDSERKIVIAIRLGEDFPLYYQWYLKNQRTGNLFETIISHGDIYFMSDKAVGYDWKKKNIYTLRHAAGPKKYVYLQKKQIKNSLSKSKIEIKKSKQKEKEKNELNEKF